MKKVEFMEKDIIANIKFKELLLPTLLIAMALNISAVFDSFFVSSLIGESALAAIQVFEPVVLFITILEWLFGLGGQILSLNCKGEFDEYGSNKYFTIAIESTVIICVIMLIVCSLFADSLINILHPPAGVLPYVQQYAPFLFLCFPISTGLGVLSQYIRVDGQPNFASYLIIIANVINVILDYVFLAHFHTGIGGAALATLIGYSVALIISLKYHFDPKRTYKYLRLKISVKEWFGSAYKICKTGFPNASTGLFEVFLVYIINRLLTVYLGEIGLVSYTACMDALLIVSILIVGLIETFSSIIPVYYSQHDYKNVKYLFKKSVMIALIIAVAFTAILWIVPDLFLMLYKLNLSPNVETFRFTLRMFSLCFIPSVFATVFIFYYEAIERSAIATALSAIAMFVGPLSAIFGLLPFMGINSVFISFAVANVMTIIVAILYVKVVERREPQYGGFLIFRKDLIPLTQNFNLQNRNDKNEVTNHLMSLDCKEEECKNVESILNFIFDNNDEDIVVEVLVIDYEDNITVNIKYTGKEGLFEEIKKEVCDEDSLKFTNVLGFNNIKYEIKKS